MILTEKFISKYKDKNPNWGFNGLGYVTYKRTYARPTENGTEEWWQTVQRCVEWLYDMHQEMNIELEKKYYEDLYDTVFNLKANFSGRMLWQAGTQTVDKLGGASLNNCYGLVVDNKKSFLHTLDYLMLGGGVGFNIQKKYVNKLPTIKSGVKVSHRDSVDADFIVPDSREGWVRLLDEVLTAYFEKGESFSYSTHLVRPYGEPIKGFGGTASGAEPLVKGIGKICKILENRGGKKLRPVDVLDIMNCLGELVVAGNVRRSAQIALGDVDDVDFLTAKMFALGSIPSHRAMSNNTVVCNSIDDLPETFWMGYQGNAEPYGLFNLDLARRKGRIIDNHRTDDEAISTNPCAEITLAPSENDGGAESCNLCELYLNNIKDAAEFKKVAKLMYVVVKTIAMMKYHHKETHKIVSKNMRLGIGLTGIVQRPDLVDSLVLSGVYNELERTDKEFSNDNGVPESIKLTTVKPSGTLSLLAGSTPGVHPAYSRRYIRRMRMASDDSLVDLCAQAGYRIEYARDFDGNDDQKTIIVEFPVELEENVITASEMSAIRQLELHKHMQTYWADNQVSVTVYYHKHELPEIRKWLETNYDDYVKTVSFLLHNEHGFDQAPYEEIDEKTYQELVQHIKPIEFTQKVEQRDLVDQEECDKGGCPIK